MVVSLKNIYFNAADNGPLRSTCISTALFKSSELPSSTNVQMQNNIRKKFNARSMDVIFFDITIYAENYGLEFQNNESSMEVYNEISLMIRNGISSDDFLNSLHLGCLAGGVVPRI